MKKQEIIALIFYLAALIFLLGCSKDSDGFIHYEVAAGQHYSNKRFPTPHDAHNITFQFKTNDTWIWDYNYSGHSKIGGIGQKGFVEEGWHINSCRATYHENDGYYIVGMEVYADRKMSTLNIDSIPIGGTFVCKIDRIGGFWHCTINGKTGVLKAGKKYKFGIRLFPHAGGSYTLSHKWIVPIKWN